MPTVSVIVPNYNHAKYLEQRLESILKQTYRNFEVIILDDCSTDNSREIIERYRSNGKVNKIVFNSENGGTSYKQWYKGIEYAQGELIWIAESDDWSDERFLETLIPHFDDVDVSIVISDTQYVYPGDLVEKIKDLSGKIEKTPGEEFIREKMLIGNGIGNAGMAVFRKNVFDKVKDNGFVNLKLCGDWQLWMELMHEHKIISVPDRLNYCRRHSTNAATRFTSLGLDFIEAVSVLGIGERLCSNKYDRKNIYHIWLDRYYMFRNKFLKGVLAKIFWNLLKYEPLMFFYFIYYLSLNCCKSLLKSIIRKNTSFL
jgi:glycosyltransferase involved in cell wall biosynthesis